MADSTKLFDATIQIPIRASVLGSKESSSTQIVERRIDSYPFTIDYTSRDFDSLVQKALSYITKRFPQWTDLNESHFGNALLESFAFVVDNWSFNTDVNMNELFIDSMTQRQNARRLGGLVGYTPRNSVPAEADITRS